MALNFRLAKQNDLQTLALLMNQAYRSQTGQSWTNEAEIVAGAAHYTNSIAREFAAAEF